MNSDLAAPLHFDKANCLVLACGNTLRSDDGVGPRLAEWAAERFRDDSHVRILARQQWTPDLAKDIAAAESVLFVDSSANSVPGRVSLVAVPSNRGNGDAARSHRPSGKPRREPRARVRAAPRAGKTARGARAGRRTPPARGSAPVRFVTVGSSSARTQAFAVLMTNHWSGHGAGKIKMLDLASGRDS